MLKILKPPATNSSFRTTLPSQPAGVYETVAEKENVFTALKARHRLSEEKQKANGGGD